MKYFLLFLTSTVYNHHGCAKHGMYGKGGTRYKVILYYVARNYVSHLSHQVRMFKVDYWSKMDELSIGKNLLQFHHILDTQNSMSLNN